MKDWIAPNDECLPPKDGEPPIHRAARLGDHGLIEQLAGAGADLNAVFDLGLDPGAYPSPATPFMVAAGSGDGATVGTLRLLVSFGADPKRVLDGVSAVNFAASGLGWNYRPGGDADRLEYVLSVEAPLPVDPEKQIRLLADVAAAGDAKRLKVLLQLDISPNPAFDPKAAMSERSRIFDQLPLEPSFISGFPWYTRFIIRRSMKAVRKQMKEIGSSGPYSFLIPLHQAVEADSLECARMLIEAGADPFQRESSGRTAIASAQSVEMIRYLESLGLRLDAPATSGWTPLVDAVMDGDLSRLKALIASGADVNAVHDRGYTVLMSAVGSMERSVEVIQLLVASGADPLATSELGYNLFHAALDVDGEANLMENVRATLTLVHSFGVDIEQKNLSGQTPLARAVSEGTGNEVQVLCELGANPDALISTRCGGPKCVLMPPLSYTVEQYVDVAQKVRALLAAGANPSAVKQGGTTPLATLVYTRCQPSRKANALYDRFFRELYANFSSNLPRRDSREQFITDLLPSLEAFVSKFFADVPTKPDFLGEGRAPELNEAISLLCAYETWAGSGR